MEHSHSPSPEQPSNAELLEALKHLRDREFLVGRKIDSKTREPEHFETGWIVEDVRELPNGRVGVVISVPEQNIAKRIYLDELLSWQPTVDDFAGDTLNSPHELESHARFEHVEEELGEVAIGASGVADMENESAHEIELSDDEKAAEARILAVLGEDGKGQNILAETLRAAGATPGEIRTALADKQNNSELRSSVQHVLMRRMSDLLAEGGHFHERVQRNDPGNLKSPEGSHDYDKDKYRSDEYVVLLALAKLDGSFDTSKERNNYTDLPADDAKQGQHRQASDTLLESFAKENQGATRKEHEAVDDQEIMKARQAVDTMLEELRAHNRLNTDQFHHIEHILYQQMPDLDEMDQQTNMLVARLQESYDAIQTALNELKRLKSGIDEHTLEGIRRRDIFESAETTIHQGMSVLSTEFAYNGVGMIDRLTSDARHDTNMQHEYRFRATQLVSNLKDAQQVALNIMETVQL